MRKPLRERFRLHSRSRQLQKNASPPKPEPAVRSGESSSNHLRPWGLDEKTAQTEKPDSSTSESKVAKVNIRWSNSRLPPGGRGDSNTGEVWKSPERLKKQSATNEDNSIDSDPGSESKNAQHHDWDAGRIRQEKSRQARLEQTKDGRFVQLGTAVQQNASESLGPQEKVANWKSRIFSAWQESSSPSNSLDNAAHKPKSARKYSFSNTKISSSKADVSSQRRPARFKSPRSLTSSSPHKRDTLRYQDRMKRRFEVRERIYGGGGDRISRLERRRMKIARKQLGPPRQISLPEFITVSNLATLLKLRVEDFGRKLRGLGFESANNDLILDAEIAGLIAAEFNFEPVVDTGTKNDLVARLPASDVSLLPTRPPVVTIMGHVDHGKTTLLDWLRKSSVAASEHGGITQHIGAFSVSMPGGRLVTFLDTPGHAAFLSMRQRGANVTDIVILVVAADDSVKPQTIEAIKHAQAAKVPMIVAVSKIDKEEANLERVKHDLARYGVEIEDSGGDTQVVCISGKTGQGMAELEDAVIALADILDMRAESDGQAEGWVIESTTNKGGRIATVLVRRGTITRGDVFVAGSTWAKVRSLRNEAGTQINAAGPGMPVEIDGWKDQPVAGDEVLQAPDEKTAKSVVERRIEIQKSSQMAVDMVAVNESRRLEQEKRELEKQKARAAKAAAAAVAAAARASHFGLPIVAPPFKALAPAPEPLSEPSQPGVKEVLFVIKADVSGSTEAVLNSITALGNSEVSARVLRSSVGLVTEFDIEHAATAKAHIICFNVTVEPKTARKAEAAGVRILDHRIIYNLVDDVKAMLSEQLTPIVTQKVLGEAEVSQVFEIGTKNKVVMPVAGCKVRNGVVSLNGKVRVLRERDIIYDGTLLSFLSPSSLTPAYERMMNIERNY